MKGDKQLAYLRQKHYGMFVKMFWKEPDTEFLLSLLDGIAERVRGSEHSSPLMSEGWNDIRSYIEKKQEQFDMVSGFGENHSDIVGNYTMYLSDISELYYDFRVSDSLDLNRNRIRTNFEIQDKKVNINYIQIKNFASRNNSDTEQISYGLERKVLKNWILSFTQHRDLAGASFSTPFKSTFGINFENDCAIISFNITRDKSYDVDIPSITNYNFNINLF